jgi:hypothetical protein
VPPDNESSPYRSVEQPVRSWLSEVKRAGCWYGIPAALAALLGYPLYWAGCSIAGRVSGDDWQDSPQDSGNEGGD